MEIRQGFNKSIYASIHNEIHRQIGELKKQGLKPCRIYLGPLASKYFIKECFWQQPKEYLGMPIQYGYRKISGVWVEGKPITHP